MPSQGDHLDWGGTEALVKSDQPSWMASVGVPRTRMIRSVGGRCCRDAQVVISVTVGLERTSKTQVVVDLVELRLQDVMLLLLH